MLRQFIIFFIQEVDSRLHMRGLPRIVWTLRRLLLGVGTVTIKYRNKFNFVVDADSPISVMTGFCLIHRKLAKLLRTLIKKMDNNVTFLDVGAHVGFVSLLAYMITEQLAKKMSMHCFEPNTICFEGLKLNNSLNGCKMYIYNIALGAEAGMKALFREQVKGTLNSSLLPSITEIKNYNFHKGDSEMVNVVSMDDFCSQNNIFPNIIKIDVEGYERMF